MILSTTTDVFFNTFGYEEGIGMLAGIGYDALDINLINAISGEEFADADFDATCRMLRSTAAKCGIFFNQSHAPFPSCKFLPDGSEDREYNEATFEKIVRAMRCAGYLGAKQIVVHPIDVPDKSIQKQYNLDFYARLIPYCREYGIKVAIENMWNRSKVDKSKIVTNVCSFGHELGDYYDSLDKDCFCVCLDLGHSGLVGDSADSAIRVLGHDRLHALHVHDNDLHGDDHTIPFQGRMDWDAITRALADVDYAGDFTYEVGGKFLKYYAGDKELMSCAFRLMEITGRRLIAMVEKAKAEKASV